MLFLRGGLLFFVAMTAWIAFYHLVSAYLSVIVAPLDASPSLLEGCFWAFTFVACAYARYRLRRHLGASIAAYQRASRFLQRLLVGMAITSLVVGVAAVIGLLYPLWGRALGLNPRPWSGVEALCWLGFLSLAEPLNRILNPIMMARLLPSAAKVLRDDTRPPVVYLRAFNAELSRATPERRLLQDFPGGKAPCRKACLAYRPPDRSNVWRWPRYQAEEIWMNKLHLRQP
jgi:hypothetical protein